MAVFVFVGSYLGLWKRNNKKLPVRETIVLFVALWVVSAGLIVLFKAVGSSYVQLAQANIDVLGPLVIGVIIGRKVISWRHEVRSERPNK